jgi:hypothetical protein
MGGGLGATTILIPFIFFLAIGLGWIVRRRRMQNKSAESMPDLSYCTYPSLKELVVGEASQICPEGRGLDGYSFQLVLGTLPGGLNLCSDTGIISGTPKEKSNSKVHIHATNEYGSRNIELYLKIKGNTE